MRNQDDLAFKSAIALLEKNPGWVTKAKVYENGMLSLGFYINGGGQGITYLQYWPEPAFKYFEGGPLPNPLFPLRSQFRLYSPAQSRQFDFTIGAWRCGRLSRRFLRLWKRFPKTVEITMSPEAAVAYKQLTER